MKAEEFDQRSKITSKQFLIYPQKFSLRTRFKTEVSQDSRQ